MARSAFRAYPFLDTPEPGWLAPGATWDFTRRLTSAPTPFFGGSTQSRQHQPPGPSHRFTAMIRYSFSKIRSRLSRHFSRDPLRNPGSSEFEVDNWLISRFIVRKLVPVVGFTPFPLSELQLMTAAVCRFRPTHIFEWGTNVGKSARVFYEVTEHFHIPAEIHSVDLPDEVDHVEHPHASRGKLVKGKARVKLHLGDGLDTSLALCKNAGPSCRPLFFVDGDHSFDSVKRELTGIISCVPNPKILVHDTFFQSSDAGYNIGPHQAIQTVLCATASGRSFRTISTNTGLPGMTLVF